MTAPPHSRVDLGGDCYKLSSRRTFNRWGAGYDRNIFVRLFAWQWDRAILRRLGKLCPGARVLDLGCATGRLLARIARAGDVRIAGVDLSESGLAVARDKLAEHGHAADLQLCDIEQQLPWAESSFDAVVLSGVLHHLPYPGLAFRQALRVLRPGGMFLVADPFFFTPARHVVNAVLRLGPVHGDCRFHHPAGAVRMLEAAGFAGAAWQRISWHSFIAWAGWPGEPRMG